MIRSTFAGFTTAQLAMAASQKALDVTGQNIANINTTGYTKQRLDIASLNHTGGDFYNSDNNCKVGYGVEITAVSQLRDPFLDMQYRSQMSKLGTTDALAAGFEQVAGILDEANMDGVRAALRDISTALQKYSEEPGAQEIDTTVRSNMQILLNLFHDNAKRLEDVRSEMTSGFENNDVADVNAMLKNIAELNKSIKNSQILGNPALELQDQRNNLLDQLASYLPITVKSEYQTVAPGQTLEVPTVYFTGSDGRSFTLIEDTFCGSLSADISGEPVRLAVTGADGNGPYDITETIPSGTLKGTLDMLNKSGAFDQSNVNGLGYFEESLDALVRTFAETFNKLNVPVKKGPDGKPMTDVDGKPILETDPDKMCPLFEKLDPNADFSASNIKIADGWMNGSYGITISQKVVNGEIPSTDTSNILNMINALKNPQKFEGNGGNGTKVNFFNGSFYDCFASMENTLAIDLKSANTTLENQLSVLKQTANARDGVSGVQLDEEGMDLMHYNQSYTAAARLMTTLDEALDTLINRTGVVGR